MNDQPFENVLLEISNKADFTFSYDAAIFKGQERISINVEEESIKAILKEVLPEGVQTKISGNHLILLRSNEFTPKDKISISGIVSNQINNIAVENIVVYEINSLVSAVTDKDGKYSLTIPVKNDQLGLVFNQNNFKDTVLFIAAKDQQLDVRVMPIKYASPTENIQRKSIKSLVPIETHSFVKQFVPEPMLERTVLTANIQQKVFQVSFLPKMGTNLEMSGLVKNQFSLNILGGYSHGVGVFELSGIFNVTQANVNGVQIAGIGNMVGENTEGFQIGGIYNHSNGSMNGFQLAGISNKVLDTLNGVQISGVSNLLRGSMKGVQIAGINNLTTEDVNGVQIAGLTNITKNNVKRLQLAGLTNYCRNVEGVQFAGIANFAAKDVKGLQFAGLFNKANKVSTYQMAGLFNISTDSVLGSQFTGIFNFAKYTEGGQIALLNFSDSTSGTPIGLMSFVKKGFHQFELFSREISPVNFAFKTGVSQFYNIFTIGIQNWGKERGWMFGYGVGSKKSLSSRWDLSLEYSGNWINEKDTINNELNLLNIFDFNLYYKTQKSFSISLGPSFNFFISEWKDAENGEFLTSLAPYTLDREEIRGTLFQTWIGGKLAVQF